MEQASSSILLSPPPSAPSDAPSDDEEDLEDMDMHIEMEEESAADKSKDEGKNDICHVAAITRFSVRALSLSLCLSVCGFDLFFNEAFIVYAFVCVIFARVFKSPVCQWSTWSLWSV